MSHMMTGLVGKDSTPTKFIMLAVIYQVLNMLLFFAGMLLIDTRLLKQQSQLVKICAVWNPKVHYCVHKNLMLDLI
jgi:hypothetical protein